jgi:hypothetical protein
LEIRFEVIFNSRKTPVSHPWIGQSELGEYREDQHSSNLPWELNILMDMIAHADVLVDVHDLGDTMKGPQGNTAGFRV